MLGQNPTSRFDYLFEPLNAVGADELTDDAVPSAAESDAEPSRSEAAPNRFVLAAIVLAVTAAAAATVVVLLRQPGTPGHIEAPVDPVGVATTEPQAPIQPVLVVPPTETDLVDEPPDVTATVEPQPPQPEPSTRGTEPDVHVRPTTRAPISVAPTPRQLFPNQRPRAGGGDGGQSASSPSRAPESSSPSDGHGRGHGR